MRELEFIEWIRSQPEWDPAAVPVGPGDDCAVVMCGGEPLLVSTDQLLDGVHVRLDRDGAEAAGRKAMARALSDIAAMAGTPLAAVAAVALPRGFSRADAEAMYRGRRQVSDAFGCPMVGGDLATWDGPLAITVTVFGRPAGAGPVLRSGARAGDALFVTGRLGGAWRTRRHLEFAPRIAEGVALARDYGATAMIDISDGLALDLWRLCKASGVGAEIAAADVPIHDDAAASAPADDEAALQAALADGEDYELLFTVPPDRAADLMDTWPLGTPVARIGGVVAGEGAVLLRPGGGREALRPAGWEHRT